MKNKLFIQLCIAALSMFFACNKEDPIDHQESRGSFDATFTKQTVYFDSSEADSEVVSISENRITFRNVSEKAQQLKKGDVILIHGKALAKADRVTSQGSQIVVETVEATLDEAIEDGTIQWTTYCDFQPETQMKMYVGDEMIEPIFRASSNEVKFNFDYGDYNYSIVMVMNKTYSDVKLEVSKKLASGTVTAKFAAEGRISAMTSENKIVYSKSQLKDFSNTNNNLQGELTLSITVAGSGNASINLTPAIVIMSYPVMVGPIPTLISMKIQFVINAVVPIDGSSKISAKFKYDSQTGIAYDGKNMESKGRIGKYSIDEQGVSQTGASSAIAANFGIGFPRIEVGVFGKAIVPWIQTAFLIGGDYTFFPNCLQARAQFIGGCGVNFEFLGFKHKVDKNLWQEEKVFKKVGECN